MRVLYVNHTGAVSGGERSLLGLLDHLPADVEPTLACPEGPLAVQARIRGIPLVHVPGTELGLRVVAGRTPRAGVDLAHSILAVRRIATRVRAGVVHANSARAGIMCAGASGPRVVHVRDSLPDGWAAELACRVLRRADLVIANSRYTATRTRRGGGFRRIEAVPNGVDLERFRPDPAARRAARANLGVRDDTALVGVVGQITPWKGQADAIEAVALVAGRRPSLLLLVVGSVKFAGSRHDNHAYLADLHRQVAERGLGDRVRFLGERDDIPQLLRALDVLLVPSWEEPFGRVVIEGMAVSTPVLATAVGGPAEVISDGEDGILLPPRRPRRWADAIDALLDDPDRRLALGCQARRTVEARFDEAQHAGRIAGFYSQLLQGPR